MSHYYTNYGSRAHPTIWWYSLSKKWMGICIYVLLNDLSGAVHNGKKKCTIYVCLTQWSDHAHYRLWRAFQGDRSAVSQQYRFTNDQIINRDVFSLLTTRNVHFGDINLCSGYHYMIQSQKKFFLVTLLGLKFQNDKSAKVTYIRYPLSEADVTMTTTS